MKKKKEEKKRGSFLNTKFPAWDTHVKSDCYALSIEYYSLSYNMCALRLDDLCYCKEFIDYTEGRFQSRKYTPSGVNEYNWH